MNFRVIKNSYHSYFSNDCPLAAAAIAYYVLLSVFPIILLTFAIGSFFLPPKRLEFQVLDLMNQFSLGTKGTLRSVVHSLNLHRTSLSIFALLGLAWSGLGIFGALRTALNQSWGVKETRSFFVQRRLEVMFGLIVGLLFLISSFTTWEINIYFRDNRASYLDLILFLRFLLASAVAFLAFSLCYQLLPNTPKPLWKASFVAGLISAALFELAKWVFLEYVSYFANYSLAYGVLGAVIIFLVWAYVTAVILLFGGQLARNLEFK